eukprot:COSAG01_NODE_34111_length_553_cov_0.784141_2_plen_118_part_01
MSRKQPPAGDSAPGAKKVRSAAAPTAAVLQDGAASKRLADGESVPRPKGRASASPAAAPQVKAPPKESVAPTAAVTNIVSGCDSKAEATNPAVTDAAPKVIFFRSNSKTGSDAIARSL